MYQGKSCLLGESCEQDFLSLILRSPISHPHPQHQGLFQSFLKGHSDLYEYYRFSRSPGIPSRACLRLPSLGSFSKNLHQIQFNTNPKELLENSIEFCNIPSKELWGLLDASKFRKLLEEPPPESTCSESYRTA